ncbi:MAG: 2,3-diaminopropionate biosynthesis protein SbnB [Acidobacteria bacterium]|nr:2,3-diaminopropionate biosynthesis protein SbnB [Acidobacteriota bacterium]
MHAGSLNILTGGDVLALLEGREQEVLDAVRRAYEAHGRGASSLPHSTFLLFPEDPRSRIIALPAYLGEGFQTAGVKWIASFPANLGRGLDRASAVLVINSSLTGLPEAFMESSVISARRTAASAALAARHLHEAGPPATVGMLGCGLINFEVARFLRAVFPDLRGLVVSDLDPERAAQFGRMAERVLGLRVEVARSVGEMLGSSPVISLATTAPTPHISDLSVCAPGATVLHVSLRDLAPEVILSCNNFADDIDHAVRAQTSLHLTEQMVGHRDFIRGTLADVLAGRTTPRERPEEIVVFSPFGLGVLDIAVGHLVRDLAAREGRGSVVDSFLPAPWPEREL